MVLVRDERRVLVYLNGDTSPEIAGEAAPPPAGEPEPLFIGGRCDGRLGLEGKIDEVSVLGRALSAEEAATRHRAAGMRR